MKKSKPEHSETGASGADRWFPCPGSVTLSRGIEGYSSPAAEQGTAAHEVLELCFPPGGNCEPSDFIGDEMTNGYVFKESDAEAVDEAIACLQKRSNSIMDSHKIRSEVSFDLTSIHDGLWGTSDTVMWADDLSVLYVDDYKHGVKLVEAKYNRQLLFYALGAIYKVCEDLDLLDQIEMVGFGGVFGRVNVGIIQPRALDGGEIHRTWEVSGSVLDAFAEELRQRTEEAYNPDASRKAGDWCMYCKAKTICPEFDGKTTALAQADFAPAIGKAQLPPVESVPIEKLLKLQDFEPIIKQYFLDIDAHVLRLMKKGESVPGRKLVRRVKHRKWTDEEKFIEDASFFADGDELFKKKLITPNQAEKKVGKDLVELHSFKPEGDLVSAPESDRRSPARLTAEQDFLPSEDENLDDMFN